MMEEEKVIKEKALILGCVKSIFTFPGHKPCSLHQEDSFETLDIYSNIFTSPDFVGQVEEPFREWNSLNNKILSTTYLYIHGENLPFPLYKNEQVFRNIDHLLKPNGFASIGYGLSPITKNEHVRNDTANFFLALKNMEKFGFNHVIAIVNTVFHKEVVASLQCGVLLLFTKNPQLNLANLTGPIREYVYYVYHADKSHLPFMKKEYGRIGKNHTEWMSINEFSKGIQSQLDMIHSALQSYSVVGQIRAELEIYKRRSPSIHKEHHVAEPCLEKGEESLDEEKKYTLEATPTVKSQELSPTKNDDVCYMGPNQRLGPDIEALVKCGILAPNGNLTLESKQEKCLADQEEKGLRGWCTLM